MYYFKEGELGDMQRLCISGVGSLYRALQYNGKWEDNERNGNGLLTYTNGDTLQGPFLHGQPHGVLIYAFNSTSKKNSKGKTIVKKRAARFERGNRIEWIQEDNKIMTMLTAFAF